MLCWFSIICIVMITTLVELKWQKEGMCIQGRYRLVKILEFNEILLPSQPMELYYSPLHILQPHLIGTVETYKCTCQ